METISSYFVFFVVFDRKSVQICFCRHCLMESCIKYTNLRYTWHKLRADINTDQVCRVMKWCKIVTLFYCCNHFICDHCRSCKFFSTMYDTMSDCIYFFQALDSACFFVCKSIQYKLDSFFVCRHCTLCDFFIKSGFLINQSSVDSDSLAKTLCQNILCIRVDELIFQGGTSAVNYQYIHLNILLFNKFQNM